MEGEKEFLFTKQRNGIEDPLRNNEGKLQDIRKNEKLIGHTFA